MWHMYVCAQQCQIVGEYVYLFLSLFVPVNYARKPQMFKWHWIWKQFKYVWERMLSQVIAVCYWRLFTSSIRPF